MKLTTEDRKALQGAIRVLVEILQQGPPEVPDRVEVWPEDVERVAAVRFKREFLQRNSMVSNDYASHRLEQIRRGTPTAWRQYTQDIRAELDAALGGGDDE